MLREDTVNQLVLVTLTHLRNAHLRRPGVWELAFYNDIIQLKSEKKCLFLDDNKNSWCCSLPRVSADSDSHVSQSILAAGHRLYHSLRREQTCPSHGEANYGMRMPLTINFSACETHSKYTHVFKKLWLAQIMCVVICQLYSFYSCYGLKNITHCQQNQNSVTPPPQQLIN